MSNTISRRSLLTAFGVSAPLAASLPSFAASQPDDAGAIAEEAYIWGLPLVLQEKYLQLARESGAPLNRFSVSTRLSTPNDRAVGPNVDTLYGYAWLDLEREPLILHVPDTQDRYYSIQLIDAYANSFQYIGRRATGTKEARYAIAGPHWRGTAPHGVERIDAPTNRVLALARTLVHGEEDLPKAQAIQAQYTLIPASRIASTPQAPLTMVSAINVFPMLNPLAHGAEYLDDLGNALAADPPPSRENAPLHRFAKAGIGPDLRPSRSPLRPHLERAITAGDARVKAARSATDVNGWKVNYNVSPFIADRLQRASVNRWGPGTHIAQEALYFGARTDSSAKPLSGASRYRLRFAPGQLPPVDAFWSLILYGEDFFLVSNPINRYSIGDRTAGLVRASDGSLEISLQHERPETGISNWLPTPSGGFQLVLRTYQPRPEVLNQTWKPPVLERIA